MGRIELELYADRLARHAERLRDDVDGGRMRIEWSRLERRAREELGQRDSAVLEALGVPGADDEQAERRLIDRRLRQLRAVERLQALVEREIESNRSSPGAVGSERCQEAAVIVVRGEEVDAHLLHDPRAVADRDGWSSLRTPHSSTVGIGFWPSDPESVERLARAAPPAPRFSPYPVSSNTPLPPDSTRASRSQAMKPASGRGKKSSRSSNRYPKPH